MSRRETIRAQYHFRRTETGLDAFDVRRLIELSRDLPVRMVDPAGFAELDEPHWYLTSDQQPTPRSIIEHVKLIRACDTSFPIILDTRGRIMDGMHRVCRALLDGVTEIPAVQFTRDPEPDYRNCHPADLPYD